MNTMSDVEVPDNVPKYDEITGGTKKECFPLATQILSIVLGSTGFVNSVTAVTGCNFFDVSSSVLARHYGSYGIFKYNMIGGWDEDYTWSISCTKYPDSAPFIDDFSEMSQQQGANIVAEGGHIKVAQVMGALSASLAGLALIASFTMICLKLPRWAFKMLSGCYFVCFITECLTFFVFDNDVCNGNLNDMVTVATGMDLGLHCSLATDSSSAIVASIFFLALGILILVCPTPKEPACSGGNCRDEGCCCGQQSAVIGHPGQVTPDGIVIMKEERINPDGTKSVTITTKPS